MALLALLVERVLAFAHEDAGRCKERDLRLAQALFERRPHWFLLAAERPATFVIRAKAARQKAIAVDDHGIPKHLAPPFPTMGGGLGGGARRRLTRSRRSDRGEELLDRFVHRLGMRDVARVTGALDADQSSARAEVRAHLLCH